MFMEMLKNYECHSLELRVDNTPSFLSTNREVSGIVDCIHALRDTRHRSSK